MLKMDKFNKIVVANWKLNGSFDFIKSYFEILNSNKSLITNVCGVICPPSIYLSVCDVNIPSIFLGAQNCSNFDLGAHTGEISVSMLSENKCQFCIIGHSERRSVFNESNADLQFP